VLSTRRACGARLGTEAKWNAVLRGVPHRRGSRQRLLAIGRSGPLGAPSRAALRAHWARPRGGPGALLRARARGRARASSAAPAARPPARPYTTSFLH